MPGAAPGLGSCLPRPPAPRHAGAPIRFDFAADGAGHWQLDGAPLPLVEGALDIDLGFMPRLEALEQLYFREAERVFRYDALVDGERFQARLDTDELGRVLLYEGLWEAETASRGGERA